MEKLVKEVEKILEVECTKREQSLVHLESKMDDAMVRYHKQAEKNAAEKKKHVEEISAMRRTISNLEETLKECLELKPQLQQCQESNGTLVRYLEDSKFLFEKMTLHLKSSLTKVKHSVTDLYHNFIERLTRDHDSIVMKMEFYLIKLVELNKNLMKDREILRMKLDSASKLIREREGMIAKLQQENLQKEQAHSDAIQSLRKAFQERIMSMSDDGVYAVKYIEVYKRKLSEMAVTHEQEIKTLQSEIKRLQHAEKRK